MKKGGARKNGVNRELVPIEGGVCAPQGFKACGVTCGISLEGKPDFAMIVSDKRCPTACVYSTSSQVGAPIEVTKYHLQRSNGLAQAIIVNSGYANVFMDDGAKLINDVCLFIERKMHISVDETVIASTGKIGGRLRLQNFEYGVLQVSEKLAASHENSLRAAEAIMTTDRYPKQASYSFELGDYVCKIGAIFKGNTNVGPNMATTLAFLTTDVNITPAALQKALSTAVRDTFNLLTIDGISSPNDTVCIMANGKAGNYVVSGEDSEYQKFVYALRSVLFEICRKIAADGDGSKRVMLCSVKGAQSKQTARILALAIANSNKIKQELSAFQPNAESILYTLLGAGEEVSADRVRIEVSSARGRIVLFADGMTTLYGADYARELLSASEIEICISFIEGNFATTAISCF